MVGVMEIWDTTRKTSKSPDCGSCAGCFQLFIHVTPTFLQLRHGAGLSGMEQLVMAALNDECIRSYEVRHWIHLTVLQTERSCAVGALGVSGSKSVSASVSISVCLKYTCKWWCQNG